MGSERDPSKLKALGSATSIHSVNIPKLSIFGLIFFFFFSLCLVTLLYHLIHHLPQFLNNKSGRGWTTREDTRKEEVLHSKAENETRIIVIIPPTPRTSPLRSKRKRTTSWLTKKSHTGRLQNDKILRT